MDNILSNQEAVNPKQVLESSSYVDSSLESDHDLLEKEALDEEFLCRLHMPKRRGMHLARRVNDQIVLSQNDCVSRTKVEKESAEIHQMQRVMWEKNPLR